MKRQLTHLFFCFFFLPGTLLADWDGWLRPSKTIDREIETVRDALSELTDVSPSYTETYVGWRSHMREQADPVDPITLTIDLEDAYPVDSVVLTPSQFHDGGFLLTAYGFPTRFTVEGSLHDDFRESLQFFDTGESDFLNPGLFPVYIPASGVKIRFVRLTIHRLRRQQGGYIASIGEISVFSDSINVALRKPVRATDSDSFRGIFHPQFVVDGYTPLGLPERPGSVMHRGWHAGVHHQPECEKFLRFIFPEAKPADKVILYPARGLQSYTIPDYGFPINYTITGIDAEGKTFNIADFSRRAFLPPRANPVFFRFPKTRVREVRIDVTRLGLQLPDLYVLAFAEVQILNGLENHAPEARLVSSDNHPAPQWSLRSVVNGKSSSGELLPFEQWFQELSRRRELTLRMEELQHKRFVHAKKIEATLQGSLVLILGLVGLFIFAQYMNHHQRLRNLEAVRQQIASDLHDDIGSNLASLLLMAEAINRSGVDSARREQIRGRLISVVRETQHAMDDIVWMLYPNRKDNNLISKLEEIAARMLPEKSLEMKLCEPKAVEFVSKRQKREMILFYKEYLHNLMKHSNAQWIRIQLNITRKMLCLSIENDAAEFYDTLPVSLSARVGKMRAQLYRYRVDSINHTNLNLPIS